MKKLVAFATVFTLAASTIGCGGATGEEGKTSSEKNPQSTTDAKTEKTENAEKPKGDLSAPGELPIWTGEGTPEISVLLPKLDMVSSYEDNEYTKWIEESCNVKLKFEFVSSVDTKTILAARVASSVELPDVMCYGLDLATAKSWCDAGAILDLKKYYDDGICYNALKNDKEYPDRNLLGNITTAEGSIYGIPKIQASPSNEVRYKMWVNQHWLDNLNIDRSSIKTTDDFKAMLTRFKNEDADGDGNNSNEIPFYCSSGGWGGTPYKFLTNAFVFEGDGDMLMLDNGNVTVSYVQDGWFKSLDYIKSLVDEGLLAKDSFTASDDDRKTLLTSSGQIVGATTNSSLGMLGAEDLLLKDEKGKYVKDADGNYQIDTANLREPFYAIDPLTGPDGVCYAFYAASGTDTRWIVTSYAKNPELCVRVGDFQFTEDGFLRGRWGTQGENWDTAENYKKTHAVELEAHYKALGYEGKYVMYNDIMGQNQNKNWYDNMPYFSGSVEENAMYVSKSETGVPKNITNSATIRQNTATCIYQTKKPDASVYCPSLHFTDVETEEIATIKTDLQNFVTKERVAYYLGQDSVLNKGKDAFIAELKKIGLDTFLETCQTAYERQYK